MMNWSGQIAYQVTSILMDSIAPHCFVSSYFANTFGLNVKEGNNILVLGSSSYRWAYKIEFSWRQP